MRQACALTGASGYVGSRLAAKLAEEFDVVPLSRRPQKQAILWSFDEKRGIAEDLRMRGVRVLVHAAWDMTETKAEKNWQQNVEGSRRLLEAATRAGVEKIVFISTISAFAGAKSEYGRSKLAVEEMVLKADGTVVRPGLVWGERPGGMFGALRKQVASGSIIPLIGGGRYAQYLVHEDDLAEAVLRATRDSTLSGQVITLAHPKPWLLRDLIAGIGAQMQKKVRFISVPWRLVYAGLKAAELAGVKLGFRSDSVLSLVKQNPRPHFSETMKLHLNVRQFVPTQTD
jgi:nucleoside-diphosphate-sugar epimerase